ncbi:unnamed protein product [Linum trigynum]|uniref:Uncharacterized protein n=1 Tax=Linum trigynum TaxID=586398 RepID=A0AAV2FTB7_9ROSI
MASPRDQPSGAGASPHHSSGNEADATPVRPSQPGAGASHHSPGGDTGATPARPSQFGAGASKRPSASGKRHVVEF